MTQKATNFSKYFALEKQIKSRGIHIDRKEAVEQYTDGKSTSLRDFTTYEYNQFCKWLEKAYQLNQSTDWQNSSENKQRRKIIALFKSMEYTLDNSKADMEAINSWCIKYSYLKKPLNDYKSNELPKLVTQAENVHKSFVEGINK